VVGGKIIVMKTLVIIFVCFFSLISFANDSLSLINKVILCKEISKDYIRMLGFKFINENEVQILQNNTNTPDYIRMLGFKFINENEVQILQNNTDSCISLR